MKLPKRLNTIDQQNAAKRSFIIIRRFLLIVFCTSFPFFLLAQETSKNNYTGSWTVNNSWVDNSAPAFTNIGSTNVNFNIQGYITLGSPAPAAPTNVTFANNKDAYSFTVTDTLVIFGDFTMANKSMNLVIASGGLLIVFGDLTLGNQMEVSSGGNIVVTGTFEKTGANNQGSYTGGGNIYAGSFDLPNGDNWVPPADQKNTGSDLLNDLPDVYEFINNGGQVLLPIELLYFISKISLNAVQLVWATSKEEGFDYFLIQHSNDGNNFSDLAMLPGAGYDTDTYKEYLYEHNNPVVGTNYYRLKAVDLDGSYEYFGPIAQIFSGARSMKVYPNPTTDDFINVDLNFNPSEGSRLAILNSQGVEVMNMTGIGPSNHIALNALRPGMYMLKFTSRELTEIRKFIVN